MKQSLIILAIFLSVNSYGQTEMKADSVETVLVENTDNTKLSYQYRFAINGITAGFTAQELQPVLTDAFKTKPSFNEILQQFIFVSTENLSELELRKVLNNYQITYFKKITIS